MGENYIFLLQCGHAATTVQVTAFGRMLAYIAVSFWVNSRPGQLESINYTSIELVGTGKALIYVSAEELKKLHIKPR